MREGGSTPPIYTSQSPNQQPPQNVHLSRITSPPALRLVAQPPHLLPFKHPCTPMTAACAAASAIRTALRVGGALRGEECQLSRGATVARLQLTLSYSLELSTRHSEIRPPGGSTPLTGAQSNSPVSSSRPMLGVDGSNERLI